MKTKLSILSILSGVLLWASWPANGLAPLLFVSLVPILYIEDYIHENRHLFGRLGLFNRAYLAFFTWNLLTTWWIYYASFFGVVMAIVFNSLFMAIVFQLFHTSRKKFNAVQGYFSLIVYWIAWEYIHHDWDLSWPWLTIGNGFAAWPSMIQWYEYTGVFGGSLWVLIINILMYRLAKPYLFKSKNYTKPAASVWISLLILIFIPTTISLIIKNTYKEEHNPRSVIIIQPNIDPYNEKFDGLSIENQMNMMLDLASKKINIQTDYIVAPETALPVGMWENDMSDEWTLDTIRDFIKPFPKCKVVIGMNSRMFFDTKEKPTHAARRFRNMEAWYEEYNTALFLDNHNSIQLYHKSKLVPGVEQMPFPAVFSRLEKFAINMGGTIGTLGKQEERSVFVPVDDDIKVAPVICYESVYGEYVSAYVKNGAGLIFIITNDGWWDDTPGYRQHCEFGRLRAIETRRSIARSANTGISCFIDQTGNIYQRTKWWEKDVISQEINANTRITFYVKYGDYIARICLLLSAITLLYAIALRLMRKSA